MLRGSQFPKRSFCVADFLEKLTDPCRDLQVFLRNKNGNALGTSSWGMLTSRGSQFAKRCICIADFLEKLTDPLGDLHVFLRNNDGNTLGKSS